MSGVEEVRSDFNFFLHLSSHLDGHDSLCQLPSYPPSLIVCRAPASHLSVLSAPLLWSFAPPTRLLSGFPPVKPPVGLSSAAHLLFLHVSTPQVPSLHLLPASWRFTASSARPPPLRNLNCPPPLILQRNENECAAGITGGSPAVRHVVAVMCAVMRPHPRVRIARA